MIFRFSVHFLLLLAASTSNANTILYKSLKYQVSPDDSLNAARESSRKQVRLEVISEIGVLINSKLNVREDSSSVKMNHEYSEIAVGEIQVKTINEYFDGSTLHTEYEIQADENKILIALRQHNKNINLEAALSEALNTTANQNKKISDLKKQNENLSNTIETLKTQISFAERRVIEDKSYYDDLEDLNKKAQILIASVKKRLHDKNLKDQKEIIKVKNIINFTEKTFIKGMTINELGSVVEMITLPLYLNRHLKCSRTISMNMNKYDNNHEFQDTYIISKLENNNGNHYFYIAESDMDTNEIKSIRYAQYSIYVSTGTSLMHNKPETRCAVEYIPFNDIITNTRINLENKYIHLKHTQ